MAFQILGDPDTLVGYRLAGVTGTVTEDVATARSAFAAAVGSSHCQVLLLTPAVAWLLEPELNAHRHSGKLPLVTVVPDVQAGGADGQDLVQIIQRAIGIHTGVV